MDIKKELEKYNLTPELYEQMLEDCSKKVGQIVDLDWSEINEKYKLKLNPDTIRKACTPLMGGVMVKEYYEQKYATASAANKEDYANKINEKTRELERMKIQYRDERNAWQKQNATAARVNQKLDYMEEQLRTIGCVEFPVVVHQDYSTDTDLLVILSDLHIGQTFSSAWGEYNTEIAKRRLSELLDKIVDIAERHESENIYISIQGDLLSGAIHKQIAITNRENVIEQVKLASELIASFCYKLSTIFNNVFISNVAGNHSRIDRKEEALHNERLDDLIGWIVGQMLSHIDNIIMLNNNIDNGIASMEIRDNLYVAVHGDYDAFTPTGLANLITMLGYRPHSVLYGHKHTCAVDEYNDVKMIRGGSLAGSGDDFTIEKRLRGKPSQMVCVCSEKGVEAYYPVELH